MAKSSRRKGERGGGGSHLAAALTCMCPAIQRNGEGLVVAPQKHMVGNCGL
jgi:hypothetical protein